ncbi:MAG TPA: pantoate--beta-alanine ligase [Opitutaceae bacterium]|nr:pantoate--beta-alanine ligase [Opitutaceae bacterium]
MTTNTSLRVITIREEWRRERAAVGSGLRVGLVPTMGALHAGHRSLLERARAENDWVALSIFVNPTQFNDPSDLKRYPRTLEADLAAAEGLVDAVFAPSVEEMYPDGYNYRLTEYNLSPRWEGAHRPGHFEGVLTVVLKLFNLVRPHRAYFGEKDWQQWQLIQGMAGALFLPVEIVGCPTVRDESGLALSSRNRRLSPAGRQRAAEFPRLLRGAPDARAAADALGRAGLEVDYVEDHAGRRLGAVRLEGIRLIDNVRL